MLKNLFIKDYVTLLSLLGRLSIHVFNQSVNNLFEPGSTAEFFCLVLSWMIVGSNINQVLLDLGYLILYLRIQSSKGFLVDQLRYEPVQR